MLFIKDIVDVAQNLQDLSYETCTNFIATIFRTRIISFSFWVMHHYIPAAGCYVKRIYEIRLLVYLLFNFEQFR